MYACHVYVVKGGCEWVWMYEIMRGLIRGCTWGKRVLGIRAETAFTVRPQ